MRTIKLQKASASYAKNRERKKHLPNERTNYIQTLQKEFSFRRQTNPFYSLRNFAKDLELNPMHLSHIFHNLRGLSRKKAETIARKLNIPYTERKRFLLQVSAASGRSAFERNLAKQGLKNEMLFRKAKEKGLKLLKAP